MDWSALRYRKVFGIPILYIALAIAAIAVFAAFKMRSTPDDTEEDALEDAEDESLDFAGDLPTTGQPVFLATPSNYAISSETGGEAVVEDNSTWSRKAVDWLIREGANPQQASNAIDKYLSGEPLSQAEGVLRDKAIREFGIPPEGLIRTSTSAYSGPASSQGVPPLSHTVKGKSDNSAAELSRLYYGMSTPETLRLIKAANSTVAEPYRVGQEITVPKFRSPKYFRSTQRVNTLPEIAAKHSKTPGQIQTLNPGIKFPVKAGTRVRVA